MCKIILGLDLGNEGAICTRLADGQYSVVPWTGAPHVLRKAVIEAIGHAGLALDVTMVVERPLAGYQRPGSLERKPRTVPAKVLGWLHYLGGLAVGMAVSYNIPYYLVQPSEWVRGMDAGPTKLAHCTRARQIWSECPCYGPRGGLLDGIADATLIAAYGAQQEGI